MQQPPQTLEQLEDQLDSVADLYRIVSTVCIAKCADPPTEGYVKVKEGLCLDRCVAKFFASSELISKTMQKYQETAQRQQQAEQQLGSEGLKSVFGL